MEAWCVELPQGLPGWGDILEAWYVEPEQVSPDWGDALDRGGALEVSNVELAQPVLAGCPLPPSKCVALVQSAPACECSLETQCASLHNTVPDRSHAPHGKHGKLAQV